MPFFRGLSNELPSLLAVFVPGLGFCLLSLSEVRETSNSLKFVALFVLDCMCFASDGAGSHRMVKRSPSAMAMKHSKACNEVRQ
jgi:hypothetical protein